MKKTIKIEIHRQKLSDGRLIDIQEIRYDTEGRVISNILLTVNGVLVSDKKIEYEGEAILKETVINEHGDTVTTDYYYSPTSELIRKEIIFSDGSKEIEERTLSPNLESTIVFSDTGDIRTKMLVFKDEFGFTNRYEHYEQGELEYYNLLENDKNGRLIRRVTYNSYLDSSDITEIEYDSYGNEVKVVYRDNNEKIEYIESNVYSRNVLKEKNLKYSSDSTRNEKTIYNHDSRSNLIEEICTSQRGDIIYYQCYEYDQFSSIVYQKIIDKIDFDGMVTEYVREIEYY